MTAARAAPSTGRKSTAKQARGRYGESKVPPAAMAWAIGRTSGSMVQVQDEHGVRTWARFVAACIPHGGRPPYCTVDVTGVALGFVWRRGAWRARVGRAGKLAWKYTLVG